MKNTREVEADRLLEQGNEQYENEQYEAALPFLQEALAIYREISDRQGEEKALRLLKQSLYVQGESYQSLKDYAKAADFIQQSLTKKIGIQAPSF
jgi:tetratricopeptide (TPR) repeat protein